MLASKSHFKESAGVLCAFIVVMAFIAIGFLQMTGKVLFGVEVTMSEAWGAAMLSLASAALGFLIGKDTSNSPVSTTGQSPSDPAYVTPVATPAVLPLTPATPFAAQQASSPPVAMTGVRRRKPWASSQPQQSA